MVRDAVFNENRRFSAENHNPDKGVKLPVSEDYPPIIMEEGLEIDYACFASITTGTEPGGSTPGPITAIPIGEQDRTTSAKNDLAGSLPKDQDRDCVAVDTSNIIQGPRVRISRRDRDYAYNTMFIDDDNDDDTTTTTL
ncbi:hypothetical protein N7490_006758 [Penicillium lividum]|nr:hypothetical protein N7490_006758 [Penicillium lividum]